MTEPSSAPVNSCAKPHREHSTVADVVAGGLCTCCGACTVVCSSRAIGMKETPAGLLHPAIDQALCTECGRCARVCPGPGLDLRFDESVDLFHGVVLDAWLASASSTSIREAGQSGGAVGALTTFLLESGNVDACATTVMPDDGAFHAHGIIARDCEDLSRGQKSKYRPSATVAALADCAPTDRVAFVGLPCHIHGVELLCRDSAPPGARVSFRIGLVCDRTLMGIGTDQLAREAGLAKEDVRGITYRDKKRFGWPGELSFRLASGATSYAPSTLRFGLKEYATPPRCRVCFDKMNVLSDIVAGDPWGVAESSDGYSVLLVRTAAGRQLVAEAHKNGYLDLERLEPARVIAGQLIEGHVAEYHAYTRAWTRAKLAPPAVNGLHHVQLQGWQGLRGMRQRILLWTNLYVSRGRSRRNSLWRLRMSRRAVKCIYLPARIASGLRRRILKALSSSPRKKSQ